MNDAKESGVTLDKEALQQTDDEKIDALVKLGASRLRAEFIVQMGHGTISGDVINVSHTEGLRRKAS